MRPSAAKVVTFCALLFFFSLSTVAVAAPSITTLSPTSGAVGASITITGTGFGSTQGTSTVKFNGTTATATSWSATSIVATVPSGATTGNVVVTVSGAASNGKSFTVVAAPNIASLSPTSGAVGAAITVTGTNLGASQGSSTIKFNGTTATPTSWNATTINVPVPSGATTGNVVVHASGVDSNGKAFTVLPTPNISSLSPTTGAVGASVTIAGTNFGTTQGTSTVKFNGTTATATAWSATSITATVPTGATTGNVVVTVSGVASNGKSFTVVSAPSITSLSPTSAAAGTSITVTGTNFGSSQGSSTIKFNGTTGTPTSWTATSIHVPVPAGATTGNVVVHASGVDSNGKPLTVLPTPAITNLSPNSGLIGAAVTITGTNFGTTQGTSTVKFNGTTATATAWNATSISTTVPAGATTGNVVVTVSGVASAGVIFTITPTISSVSPTSGAVGTSVTISGTNFQASQGSSMVTFNGTLATPTSWGATSISVPVPAGASTGNVVVTIGGVAASNGVPFAVTPSPNITSLSPTSGPAGTPVTVSGTNFGATQGTSTITFNGTVGTPTSWTDTSITVPVPSGAISGVVQIQQSGGALSNSVSFTVTGPPIVTGVSPASGIPGLQITISGGRFGSTQGSGSVWLGTAYGIVVSWSDTQVVASIATGSTSGVAQILQDGKLSNAINFTVNTPRIDAVDPGAGAPGTTIAFYGSGFGNTQGSGSVWLGNTYGIVSMWSDTEVDAVVAAGAQSGTAKISQNGIWSNASSFTVLGSGKTSADVSLKPNLVNMVVGETRTLQAVDVNGTVLPGLVWASSDPAIATLSTDDPPIITATAPGSATITAGDGSAYVTVYPGPTLPEGTVIWSNPGDGSGVYTIVPAVPSAQGVADVFAIQGSGKVQAITSEGKTAWTANLPGNSLVPDFQGGLIAFQGNVRWVNGSYVPIVESLTQLEGMTGQTHPTYTPGTGMYLSQLAVHTDGTIFAVKSDSIPTIVSIVGIDPQTGGEKFSIATPGSKFISDACNPPSGEGPATVVSGPIIGGDGFAYVAYLYRTSSSSCNVQNVLGIHDVPLCNGYYEAGDKSISATMHLEVLRIASDGTHSAIPIKHWDQNWTWHSDVSCTAISSTSTLSQIEPWLISVGNLITDADQGVLVSWEERSYPYCQNTSSTWPSGGTQQSGCFPESRGYFVRSTRSGLDVATLSIPGQAGPVAPVLQREDGSFIGTVSTETGNAMVGFSSSGSSLFSVAGDYQPQIATADGGVIATNAGSTVTFDENGNATGQLARSVTQSWSGNQYQIGSVEAVAGPLVFEDGASFWPIAGGNPSATATAILQCPCLLQSATTPASTPPSGNQKTYLLLAGDQGLNLGPGHNHSVGELFNLAAETKASSLGQSPGNKVITQRVSSVSDFNAALTTNGQIDGDITFFGHAGIDGHGNSSLFPGQNPGDSNNISALNVAQLSNTHLDPNVTITLNACHAGLGGRASIAQLIAIQLKRKVLAYPVDMYFSSDPTPKRFAPGMVAPSGVPVYMVPNGDGIQPIEFPLH